jgi:hypothetical protein
MNMEHWWDDSEWEKPNYKDKGMSQSHSVQHKSQMDWWNGLVLQCGLCSEKPVSECLTYGMTS